MSGQRREDRIALYHRERAMLLYSRELSRDALSITIRLQRSGCHDREEE